MIEGQYGYVYCITNKVTGRKYIGRKYFTKAATRQVNGKKKKTRVNSGWQNYFGSNKTIIEDVATMGAESSIVRFCISVRIVQSAVTMRLMKYLYEGVCLRLNTIMIGSHVRFVKLI